MRWFRQRTNWRPLGRLAVHLVIVSAPLAQPAAAQSYPLDHASWLAGCWEARTGGRVTMEMWLPPAGGMMIGGSRTTMGDTTREFEHLRLVVKDGRLIYTAIPSGQRETAFTSTTVSDTLLVFENLQHDFPQRIIYRRRGTDSVVARVEGPAADGTTRGFTTSMRRAICTAPDQQQTLAHPGRDIASPTLAETILQVASHSTYHRGQVNTRLRQLGAEPPLVDYVAWIWFDRPAADWPARSIAVDR
jgi:hypothetical protein